MKSALFAVLSFFCLVPRVSNAQGSLNSYNFFSAGAGITVCGIGNITAPKGPVIYNDGAGAGPTILLEGGHVYSNGFSLGLRAEVAFWNSKSRTGNANPATDQFKYFYAAPAICIAPVLGKRVLQTQKQDFFVGVYAGFAFSPHKAEGRFGPGSQILEIHFPPTSGFQLGLEAQYHYWVTPALAVGATAGFQRNLMRDYDDSNFGFNLNAVPVTAGVSFRL